MTRSRSLPNLARSVLFAACLLVPALATAAAVRIAGGDASGALGLVQELEGLTRDRDVSRRVQELPVVARICAASHDLAVVRALIPRVDVPFTRGRLCVLTGRAAVAEADGDLDSAAQLYAAAAVGWREFGCPTEEAYALLGQARALIALDRWDEATAPIRAAGTIAARLGARPLLIEAEAIGARARP